MSEVGDEGDNEVATCFRARSESLLMWKMLHSVFILPKPAWTGSGDVVQPG